MNNEVLINVNTPTLPHPTSQLDELEITGNDP